MKRALKTGGLLWRAAFNIVLAAIIYSITLWLLGKVPGGSKIGLILSTVVAVALIVVIVPYIYRIRKGTETIANMILALPLGVAIVTLVNGIFNLSIPSLTLPALGSLNFVIAMSSYYLGDLIYVTAARAIR